LFFNINKYYAERGVNRGGFEFFSDRFKVYGIPRYASEELKRAFLPQLTLEGKEVLKRSYGDQFVRFQLKHHGVGFSEQDLKGDGTNSLKEPLKLEV
jgi:hypothetical protein